MKFITNLQRVQQLLNFRWYPARPYGKEDMQYSQYSSTNKQLHLLQLNSLFLLSALLVEFGEGTIEFPELDPLNNIMFSKLFSQFNLKYHKMIFSMVNFIKDVQVSIVQKFK